MSPKLSRTKKAKPMAQKPAMTVKMIGYKCEKLFMNYPKIESKFLNIYNQIA